MIYLRNIRRVYAGRERKDKYFAAEIMRVVSMFLRET